MRSALVFFVGFGLAGCGAGLECSTDTHESEGACVADQASSDYTCLNACEKRLLICGFDEFSGVVTRCVDACLAEPPASRALSCYRDATCVEIAGAKCTAVSTDYSCQDACEKRLLVCGFDEFGGALPRCVDACLTEPAATRALSCYRDSTCVQIANAECTPVAPREPYQAYYEARGPWCGKINDQSTLDRKCEPGDYCRSPVSGMCDPSTDDTYEAFYNAGGPWCGKMHSMTTLDRECRAGDNCVSSETGICDLATNGTYDAYYNAGGPWCGKIHSTSTLDRECRAGDNCVSSETGNCESN